jgi:tRNA A-37 threonylcarbamoyl transferase component Bud32
MKDTSLKRLDEDCLLDGQLHPSIHERLSRVRELPLTQVANLIGVERVDGVAQLVWEFVPGRTLETIRGDAPAWGKWAREVILAVEALHSTGIVHGAIHERNTIVDQRGEIRLTHVSPLLYSDTDHDAADVADMLDTLVSRDAPDSKLAKLLGEARQRGWPLAQVYARIVELDAEPPPPEPEVQVRRVSIGALVAAGAVAAIGVAVAAGVVWYAGVQ